MKHIFENQDFIKEFISEWGELFPDSKLLLENDEVEECNDLKECGDEATIKVTKEEDELTENDRICEDVMFEFSSSADAELAKLTRVKPGNITGKQIAIGTLLAASIYYAFQTYRLLRKQGKDPDVAKREQVAALKRSMSKCNKTKNPKLCAEKFKKQIAVTQRKTTA
jgi:hypothetical protein